MGYFLMKYLLIQFLGIKPETCLNLVLHIPFQGVILVLWLNMLSCDYTGGQAPQNLILKAYL